MMRIYKDIPQVFRLKRDRQFCVPSRSLRPLIIFDIPVLKETRPEKQIVDEWKASLPGILGGFFTAISNAMVVIDSVSGHERFRMSDFAKWGAVLAEALGYSREEFL
jgi:hypothetical protein